MHRFGAGINLTTSDLQLKKFGDYEYFTFKVFESKTEKTFTKLVIHPKLVRLIKAFIKKYGPGYSLFHKDVSRSNRILYYCEVNRSIFQNLGIDVTSDGQGNQINYWRDKAEHALRHCGIKLWLRRLAFNANLVALMTHDDVSTTTKVYGGLSVESLFLQGHCWFHDPPEIKSENAVFCSLKCALQYLNKSDDGSNYEARDLEKELNAQVLRNWVKFVVDCS
jgi:integrase